MTSPFFSIITASYNYGSMIEATLESIRCQDFPSFEHIIVDGGSTDNTHDVLKKYSDTYDMRWVSETDRGISDAMNKAVKLSKGKYILVIQADDRLVSSTILAEVHEQLVTEHYDIYGLPIIYYDETGRAREFAPSKHFNFYYKFKNCFRSQGAFIHRRLFDRVGWFREDLEMNMDYDLYYRAMLQGCKAAIGDVPVAVMARTGLSSRHENTEKRIALEFKVQRENEKSRVWRAIQLLYRPLYSVYKFGWRGVNLLRPLEG